MSTFFAMGGYGAFIWPAYGVSALALIGIVWQSWAAWRAASKKLDALESGTAHEALDLCRAGCGFLVAGHRPVPQPVRPSARSSALRADRQAGAGNQSGGDG